MSNLINKKPAPRLVGITGRARAGKTTVAEFLVASFGYEQHSFADPIRRFTCHLLGITPAELEAAKEQAIPWIPGFSPRRLMQTLGTEWGRDMVSPALWIDSCLHRAAAAPGPVVISDVRFDNEAAAIRERGGVVLRIKRDVDGVAAHRSESGVEESLIDRTIHNDGSIADLRVSVLRALLAVKK